MAQYPARLQQALLQSASAWTDESLVAAATGKKIRVAQIFVTSDTAGTVTLESGNSTRVWEVYPGANGGMVISAPVGEALFDTDSGEALTVTSSIASAKFVSVLYWIE